MLAVMFSVRVEQSPYLRYLIITSSLGKLNFREISENITQQSALVFPAVSCSYLERSR